MPRLLLVDDDKDILLAIKRYFEAMDYEVCTAETGAAAADAVAGQTFDCIVLDVMLPDQDGFAVCERIREESKAPIIFLSCRDEVEDKVGGLMSGGDDYMTKPFSLTELEARIRAQIRRNTKLSFFIDLENRTLVVGGRCTVLPQKEFELLMLLYQNPDSFFTTEELSRRLWNEDLAGDANNVAVHIKRLRARLSALPMSIGEIQTTYRRGYRFVKD